MINYQIITIDLQPDYREPVVQMYLSERDVGRPIQVNVLMQGQPYSFIAGTTVHIDLRKPSGKTVQVDGNYAVGSNVVLFNVVKQMAAEPGMCLTELSIIGDGQDPIGSKNWLTKVEISPMHAGDPSETWIEDLDELVQDAMEGHIDPTLTVEGDAADAKAAGDAIAAAIGQIPTVDDTLTTLGAAADAKATGDRIDDLQSTIEAIEPGLSAEAKAALLACFQNVAWIDASGKDYYEALANALGMGDIVIKGTDLGNYSMWLAAYPYYSPESRRLIYYNLDLSVEGGAPYKFLVDTLQSNVNAYINVYNQNTLDHYAQQASMDMSDKMDLFGGWLTELDHDFVVPKYLNGSKVVGLQFGFKYADNSDISSDAINTVTIKKINVKALPPEYWQYDYISANGSGNLIATDYTGMIKTAVYDDLSQVSIYLDYFATNSLGTSNAPILGMRGRNDWTSCICIYITSGTDYTIYSLTSNLFSNAVVKNRITHLDLRQAGSPSTFIENGVTHNLMAATPVVVNAPLCLFANPINEVQHQSINITNNVQLGQFVIQHGEEAFDTYVPVVRITDNVIGVFNLANQRFYTCSDVTKATIGNANCIYQVGNWEQ